MSIIHDTGPDTHAPLAQQAEHLRAAVLEMAVRYGQATQQYAYALNAHPDERAVHMRAMSRRFATLQRLVRALAIHAGGAR